jgi:hypothetical protein
MLQTEKLILDNLTTIIPWIITIIFAIVHWLGAKNKLVKELSDKMDLIGRDKIISVISDAESLMNKTSEEKKQFVAQSIIKFSESKGIKISNSEVNLVIEFLLNVYKKRVG